MSPLSDDELKKLQHEVQRLLGRCLLRLQQYERRIKAIIVDHEISGPAHALEAVKEKRIAETARKTLGTLVGDLLGSYVVGKDADPHIEATTDSCEPVNSVSMRFSIQLPDAVFARTQNELRELVELRNNLVHHFIDQYDLGSLDGCRAGCDALVTAYNRIEKHDEELRTWGKDMLRLRRSLADFFQSEEGSEWFVNGVAPDGVVIWPAAGIVYALRRAARTLAVDGWTSLQEAREWIAEREPEQEPKKYGCRSWRQVVHESRAFELQYFEVDGQRTAWYREKKTAPSAR